MGQTGQALALLHRSGSVHDSNGAIEFVCQCVQTVREALPAAKVETRMDSAFFSDEMVQALEALKLEYTISVPFARLAALKDLVEKRRLWWHDVTAEYTTIASESLSGEITGKTYEAKKIHL